MVISHIKQHTLRLRGNLFPFICCSLILQDFKLLHVKLRPAYRDNMLVLWCLFGPTTAHRVDKAEEEGMRGEKQQTVRQKCLFFYPLTDWRTEAWVNHNSKHRTPLHVLSLPSSVNTLRWWTCVRWWEKVKWLTKWWAALHLGSLTGSCKRKDRQKESVAHFSWRRQTSSYRSAVKLTELTVSSFLPQRSRSLRLPGVKTFHFWNTVSCSIFLWVCCLFGPGDVLSSVGL